MARSNRFLHKLASVGARSAARRPLRSVAGRIGRHANLGLLVAIALVEVAGRRW